MDNKCLAMRPLAITRKRGRPDKCRLDVVRDDMRTQYLTLVNAPGAMEETKLTQETRRVP